MTVTTAPLPAGEQPEQAEQEERPDQADPGLRGRLDIRQRAVEKIIAAAAGEVDGVGGSVHRVLGQALGSADPDSHPQATATIAGDLVTAELAMSVLWPTPVPQTAGLVRERVTARLDRLARLRLGHLDITVTALPQRAARRRLD